MNFKRLTFVILSTVVLAGCGKDKGSAPAGTPIALDPVAVCTHVNKLSGDEDSAEMNKECVSALESMKKQVGEENFNKVIACAMAAKTEDDLTNCDPEKMKMGASDSEAAKEYVAKSKTTEATTFLRKLHDGARMFYIDPPMGDSLAPPEHGFPKVSVGPTPPLGTCCKTNGKCAPDAAQWQHETWVALQFSVEDPHYYSYEYIADSDGKKFTVRAMGDLDCDGEYSTFSMSGEAAEGDDMPSGNPTLFREKELE